VLSWLANGMALAKSFPVSNPLTTSLLPMGVEEAKRTSYWLDVDEP